MTQTLQERHAIRRLQVLREQIKVIDKQTLLEHKTSTLLLEAMDEDDLNKVTAIIQKLNSVKSPQLPRLTQAIEKAQAEINKYTAGGPLVKAWTKLKQIVGVDNPIVKVTTFADALERGFSQIPTILKNNGVDLKNADLSKSLSTLLSPTLNRGTQNEADSAVNAQNKLKSIVAQLQKALSPGGIFGAFKKVPYINSQELAQELVKAPINVFSQVAKKITSGAKAAEIAPDMQGQIGGHGEEQTTHPTPSEPTKPASQTQPTQPQKPTVATTGTTPPGERPTQQANARRGGGAEVNNDPKKAVFDRLKDAGAFKKVGLNDVSAQALLDDLDDIGALKTPG